MAIASGDKDFIVSPPNRKTGERARRGKRGENKQTKNKRTKSTQRKRKENRNESERQSDHAQRNADANFSARLRARGREKCTTRPGEPKPNAVSLRQTASVPVITPFVMYPRTFVPSGLDNRKNKKKRRANEKNLSLKIKIPII